MGRQPASDLVGWVDRVLVAEGLGASLATLTTQEGWRHPDDVSKEAYPEARDQDGDLLLRRLRSHSDRQSL